MPTPIKGVQVSGIWVTLYVCIDFLHVELRLTSAVVFVPVYYKLASCI